MAVFVDSIVGTILAELLRAVLDAKTKATEYKALLITIETTLQSITPDVEKMVALKERLDSGDDDEMKRLWNIVKEGKDLVEKCAKGKGWFDCFRKKTDYSDQLRDLERSLTSFCQIELPIRQRVGQIEMSIKVDDIGAHVKNIQDKIEDVSEGVKNIQRKVDHSNPNGPVSSLAICEPPDPPKLTVGLDEHLGELKREVLKEGMSTVVISAPGGCGKTTLTKLLCHDKEVKGKFKDNILFVTVSRTPDLRLIIRQLLLHKGYKETEFPSDEYATNHLERMLKDIGKKPILLVLDDVWNGSEFLIDLFAKSQLADYKIVVTSRSRFPRFSSTITLNKLTEEDSMLLFSDAACLNESPVINKEIVNQVVKACKGFPLALTVVGKSLCRQPAAIWKKRLMEWSKGSSIFESHPELVNCLKTSLDALDNKPKLKESYMDLGSFPEGELIPAITLIDIWKELHEMNDDDEEVIGNIHELSTMNLLDVVTGRKCTSECSYDLFVTQHDFLRELVNHLSRDCTVDLVKRLVLQIQSDEFPQWWREQKQTPATARLISITTDESFSSCWISMQAPKVRVLVLNFRSKEYMLPEFVTSMIKLKVLVVKSYGVSPAIVKNWWLLNKLSNLRRITLEQVWVPSLSLGTKFKNLQKLFFHKCDFGQAPNIEGTRTSDVFPNLMEINISYSSNMVDLPIGLCDILHLKKLSITHCHRLSSLPTEISNLTNLEVLRLCSCICLQELPDTIRSLHRLHTLDISDCESIKKLPEQIDELKSLKKLFMTGCSVCRLPSSVKKLTNWRDIICDMKKQPTYGTSDEDIET